MKLLWMLLLVAAQTTAQKSPVFIAEGKAIHGYDPVAFFSESKPVKGDSSITANWQGATWWFASTANRDKFLKQPEAYAPQYGGYCAYGVSDGHKAPTQIDTWSIVEDKLYFNYSQKVKSFWSKDIPGHIKKANANWPTIKDKE
jgi:YHS domain-containing protein